MSNRCEFGREHVEDVGSDWRCKFVPADCDCKSDRRVNGAWDVALKFDVKFNAWIEQGKCGLCGVKHRHPSTCKIRGRWREFNKYGPPFDWGLTWGYTR